MRSPASSRTYAAVVAEGEEEEEFTPPSPAKPQPPAKQPKFSYMDVYFFVPNLIGYTRVGLTLAGLYLVLRAHRSSSDEWMLGLGMYTTSFVLDFFDGYFARMFSQCSNFGAVLDMVTDRVSTMLLLVLLCLFYHEQYFEPFALLAALDYSSHWVQMYAAKGHHKTSNADKNWLVRVFYGVYPFFAFCCAGTEVFYIAMAARRFLGTGNEYLNLALPVLFAACVCKNLVNVAQLFSGFEAVAKADASD